MGKDNGNHYLEFGVLGFRVWGLGLRVGAVFTPRAS